MSYSDILQRFLFDHMPVRGEYIHLTHTFQTIVNQHQYTAPVRQLLGEALAIAGLLNAMIKFEGRLTIQFRGNGKLKLLLAQCNHQLQMRGLVKCDGEITYDSLMDAFQNGVLVIMLDSYQTTNRYQSIISWRGHSLAESIEIYFKESEQLRTKIWLNVNKQQAVGFLLQTLPEKEAEKKSILSPHFDHLLNLSMQLSNEHLQNDSLEDLLRFLYPHEIIRIFPEALVSFFCACTRKRSEEAISLLGEKEALDEIVTKKVIVVTCDFCNKEYAFDKKDVMQIFEKPLNSSDDRQLH